MKRSRRDEVDEGMHQDEVEKKKKEEDEEDTKRLRVLVGTCSWTDPTLIACGRFYPNPRAKGLMSRSASSAGVFAPSPSSSSSSSSSSTSSSSSSASASPSSGEKRLWFYSRQLPSVEVDASNYAIPAPHLCEAWCSATPSSFTFNVKAFCLFTAKQIPTAASLPASIRSKMTHELQQKSPLMMDDLSPALQMELWDCLNNSMSVFHRAGKLGAVLFQFPLGFTDTPQNREYVLHCRRRLRSEFTMAVEFRCASWLAQGSGDESSLIPSRNCTPGAIAPSYVKEDVMEWLRRNQMVFVVVDEFLEEWPDTNNGSSSSSTTTTTSTSRFVPKQGPAPTFVSSHALLSTPSSSASTSSAGDSSSSAAKPHAPSTSSASSVAALGFELCSRLFQQEEQDQATHHDTSHAAANAAEDGPAPNDRRPAASPRRGHHGRKQLFADDQTKAMTDQAKQQKEGKVERKVRMVPIVERTTSPSVCYVRIHRRRGTEKRLTPTELDEWALRVRRLGQLLKGQGIIYVMMNTNYEDQGIQNATELARRLPDLVPDWKAIQEEEAQQAKRHFMSLLFAGAAKKKKHSEPPSGVDDEASMPQAKADSGVDRRRPPPQVEEEVAKGGTEASDAADSEEAEEADVVIVGHRHKAKEQKTIDALFTGQKRKRNDDDGDDVEQADDQAVAPPKVKAKSPATKKTRTKAMKSKTPSSTSSPARDRGQRSLMQAFNMAAKASSSSSSSSSSS